jgi:hypothetical protein
MYIEEVAQVVPLKVTKLIHPGFNPATPIVRVEVPVVPEPMTTGPVKVEVAVVEVAEKWSACTHGRFPFI